jgi:protein TonB
MELTNDPSFSMYPREVALAHARRWRRALTFSVVVHLLAVAVLLQQHLLLFQNLPVPLPPLTVVMMKAVQVPAAVLAPPAVEQPARQEPVRESRQQPLNRRPAPSPEILQAPADSTVTTPVAANIQTTSDAAPPQVQAAPVVVASPPTAQRHIQAPDPAALAGYNRALAAAVDRHKRYPRIALIRQWQGTVVLQLNIGVDGRVQEHRLARSSGYEALDQQALEMLREAMPLPALPAQLAGVSLSVDIPVVFRIED